MQLHMLAPGAALALWTLIVLLWLTIARFSAFGKAGIDVAKALPGLRGGDIEDRLPAPVAWKSHNYTHLLEQPTIFYPIVIILALAGPAAMDIWLAWAYVAIRIVHSIWQSTVNRISVRANLFFLSTLILLVLAVRAVMITVSADIGGIA